MAMRKEKMLVDENGKTAQLWPLGVVPLVQDTNKNLAVICYSPGYPPWQQPMEGKICGYCRGLAASLN
jgi:hypothetical protein